MTDTAELDETHDGHVEPTNSILTPYRGQPVMAAGVAIPNASGGLQDALKVDPVELEIGSRVHVVLECEVRPPKYEPIDKNNNRGPLRIVNVLRAEEGTFVEASLVREHLDRQRERIEQAESIEEERRRREAGEEPLPFPDDEPAAAGDVLDDVLGTLGDAEADDAWRTGRRGELEEWTKGQLVTELADEHDLEYGTALTKQELVELVLEAEAADRG